MPKFTQCSILSIVNVMDNSRTSLNHCLIGGLCVQKDVHVLIHAPFTKPEKKHQACGKFSLKQNIIIIIEWKSTKKMSMI